MKAQRKDLYTEKLYLVLEKVINNFLFGRQCFGAQKQLPLSNTFWFTTCTQGIPYLCRERHIIIIIIINLFKVDNRTKIE